MKAPFQVEIKRFDHWNPHPEAAVRDRISDYESSVAEQGGRIIMGQTDRFRQHGAPLSLGLGADLAPPPGDHGMSLEVIYRTLRAAQIPTMAEVIELPIPYQSDELEREAELLDYLDDLRLVA